MAGKKVKGGDSPPQAAATARRSRKAKAEVPVAAVTPEVPTTAIASVKDGVRTVVGVGEVVPATRLTAWPNGS